MGGAESTASSTLAWRILDVLPNSPCESLGLIPYFDFVVGCDGYRLSMQADNPFEDFIHGKSTLILTIFNYKTRVKRDLSVNVSSDGSLGLILVPCDFANCDDYCIRLVKVSERECPAASIGLSNPSSKMNDDSDTEQSSPSAGVDYLLGTPVECFTSVSRFRSILADFEDETLPIWVYRSSTAELWKTVVVPSYSWRTNDGRPASGLLGCDIGSGFLHKLPALRDDQSEIKLLTPPVVAAPDSSEAPTSTAVENPATPVGRVISEPTPVSASSVTSASESRPESTLLSFPSPPASKATGAVISNTVPVDGPVDSSQVPSSESDHKTFEQASQIAGAY